MGMGGLVLKRPREQAGRETGMVLCCWLSTEQKLRLSTFTLARPSRE